ncbi:hypothetical protein NC652_036999 [Populus alba x Populus x berolinensis]|uniref:Uncharacterized protein n=3 Tax=Populus TaxID=3689 RepID=A0A8X8C8X1_POPTO|nr:hypothetical protein POTOM_052019 [Populus tomentosa]KAJ6871506.1 hypothetical protein NC652_036999 [Populus alba x Populus x berolinensis]
MSQPIKLPRNQKDSRRKVQKPEKRFDRVFWSLGLRWLLIGLVRSNWLNQSANISFLLPFFRLAFDSNAEPIRNLRVELKRYMGRHGYLSYEAEWKEVSRSYGILKEESNVGGESLELGKGKTTCR